MSQRTDYVVTDLAGPRVAGRVVRSGQTIGLTIEEARFEIMAGSIRRPGPTKPPLPQPAQSAADDGSAPKVRKK